MVMDPVTTFAGINLATTITTAVINKLFVEPTLKVCQGPSGESPLETFANNLKKREIICKAIEAAINSYCDECSIDENTDINTKKAILCKRLKKLELNKLIPKDQMASIKWDPKKLSDENTLKSIKKIFQESFEKELTKLSKTETVKNKSNELFNDIKNLFKEDIKKLPEKITNIKSKLCNDDKLTPITSFDDSFYDYLIKSYQRAILVTCDDTFKNHLLGVLDDLHKIAEKTNETIGRVEEKMEAGQEKLIAGQAEILKVQKEILSKIKGPSQIENLSITKITSSQDAILQARDNRFIGRKEQVKHLIGFLSCETCGTTQIVTGQTKYKEIILGTGGIGKTELCKNSIKLWLEELERNQKEIPPVLYIDCSSISTYEGFFESMLTVLETKTESNNLTILLDLLSHKGGLYYFDNLESFTKDASGKLVEAFIKISSISNIKVLASSREDIEGIEASTHELEVMEDVDAFNLFKDISTISNYDEHKAQLFIKDVLGNLPLAIVLVAKKCNNKRHGISSLEELQQKWDKERTKLARLKGQAENSLTSLNISISLSVDNLKTSESETLTLLYFYINGLPKFCQDYSKLSEGILVEHKLYKTNEESIGELFRLSLLYEDENKNARILQPIRDYILDNLIPKNSQVIEFLKGYFEEYLSKYKYPMKRNHIENEVSALFELLKIIETSNKEDFLSLYDLFLKSELFHINLVDSLNLLHYVEKNCLNELTAELKALTYYDIGFVYCHQGKYAEALEYYNKSLQITLKIYGEEHPSTATSYSNIGLVYDSQGKYDEALEYFNKANKIYLRTYGEEHPNTATSYNNIGFVYHSQGKYDEALEYYNKALDRYKKIYGEDHSDTATSYNNIGLVYDRQGKYDEALKLWFKTLEILDKFFPKDHPNSITTSKNIAGCLQQNGQEKEAIEFIISRGLSF